MKPNNRYGKNGDSLSSEEESDKNQGENEGTGEGNMYFIFQQSC